MEETLLGPWKCAGSVVCGGGSVGCGDKVGMVGSGGGTEVGCDCGLGSGDGTTEAGLPTLATGSESFW